MARTMFSKEQLEIMRAEYAKIERMNVETLPKFHRLLERLDNRQLAQIAGAKIRFVSMLAGNEQRRRDS